MYSGSWKDRDGDGNGWFVTKTETYRFSRLERINPKSISSLGPGSRELRPCCSSMETVTRQRETIFHLLSSTRSLRRHREAGNSMRARGESKGSESGGEAKGDEEEEKNKRVNRRLWSKLWFVYYAFEIDKNYGYARIRYRWSLLKILINLSIVKTGADGIERRLRGGMYKHTY